MSKHRLPLLPACARGFGDMFEERVLYIGLPFGMEVATGQTGSLPTFFDIGDQRAAERVQGFHIPRSWESPHRLPDDRFEDWGASGFGARFASNLVAPNPKRSLRRNRPRALLVLRACFPWRGPRRWMVLRSTP